MLRELTRADISEIVECYNCANRLFAKGQQPNAGLEDFDGMLQAGPMLGYGRNPLRGFVSYHTEGAGLCISSLYVHIDYARAGIGGALLSWAEKQAADKGAQVCWLSCLKNAPWAIDFYKKHGYRAFDEDNAPHLPPEIIHQLAQAQEGPWAALMYNPACPEQ